MLSVHFNLKNMIAMCKTLVHAFPTLLSVRLKWAKGNAKPKTGGGKGPNFWCHYKRFSHRFHFNHTFVTITCQSDF